MPREILSSYDRLRLNAYTNFRKNERFIPRVPELRALEGDYDHFILSCKHKDILRASDSPHFMSCFKPTGFHNTMPVRYCSRVDNIAIIYQPDRSGKFRSRAFIFFEKSHARKVMSYKAGNGTLITEVVPTTLSIQKIYGTGLCEKTTWEVLSKTGYEVRITGGDFYV